MHRFVIAFEGQHVVGIGFDDFPRDLFLGAHRVHRHDTTGEFQHAQQFGQSRDFVALVGDFQLAQHQTIVLSPGADHVFDALIAVERAAQCLAVQRHNFLLHRRAQALRPAQKTVQKGLRVQRREQAIEGVVAGNAAA
jgi:hypothetical protein